MSADEPLIRPERFTPTRDDLRGRSWFAEHRFQLIATTLLIGTGWFVWFIFTAKSVQLAFEPADANTSISGGFDLALGGIYVLREGVYELHAEAEGYEPLIAPLTIGEERNQSYRFALTPLPGRINFDTTPAPAEVLVDQVAVGTTPLKDVDVAAGPHKVVFRNARYQHNEMNIVVEGKRAAQSFSATLLPNWATITTTSQPEGAAVFVDEQEIGTTPGAFEVVAGVHELRLKRAGFKTWRARLEVVAQQNQTLPSVALEAADGLMTITSKPAGCRRHAQRDIPRRNATRTRVEPWHPLRRARDARGLRNRATPVSTAAERRTVAARRAGRTHRQSADHHRAKDVRDLHRRNIARYGQSDIHTTGAATKPRGSLGRTTRRTRPALHPSPGLTQEINVRLLTRGRGASAGDEAARQDHQWTGDRVVFAGYVQHGQFAARTGTARERSAARSDADEAVLSVDDRDDQRAVQEVRPKHDSGIFEDHKLNNDDQPVAKVTWIGRGAVLQLPVRARSPAAVLPNRRQEGRRHQSKPPSGIACRPRPSGNGQRGRCPTRRPSDASHGATTFRRPIAPATTPTAPPRHAGRSRDLRIQRQSDRQRAGRNVPGRRARSVRHRRQRLRVDQRLLRDTTRTRRRAIRWVPTAATIM